MLGGIVPDSGNKRGCLIKQDSLTKRIIGILHNFIHVVTISNPHLVIPLNLDRTSRRKLTHQ